MQEYYVYIMPNGVRTLYFGVTNDLMRRVFEHKEKLVEGLTKKYNITMLVFYESTGEIQATKAREKQLKKLAENQEGCSHRVSQSPVERLLPGMVWKIRTLDPSRSLS